MTKLEAKSLIAFWTLTSRRDWSVFKKLKRSKDYIHALFFLHLTIEKRLKAIIVKKTKKHAPFTHHLSGLAIKADLNISDSLLKVLDEINQFNIEGRYPEELIQLKKRINKGFVDRWQKKAEEILEWLDQELRKS